MDLNAVNMHNRAPKDLENVQDTLVPWYSSKQKISFYHLHAFLALTSPTCLPANLDISFKFLKEVSVKAQNYTALRVFQR